jgi:hypothetical protein
LTQNLDDFTVTRTGNANTSTYYDIVSNALSASTTPPTAYNPA